MLKNILNSEKLNKPFSFYGLVIMSAIVFAVLTVLMLIASALHIAVFSGGQDIVVTLHFIMSILPLGVGLGLLLSILMWSVISLNISHEASMDIKFKALCMSPEKILKYELLETYGGFITLVITYRDNRTEHFYKNVKSLKAYDTLKNQYPIASSKDTPYPQVI